MIYIQPNQVNSQTQEKSQKHKNIFQTREKEEKAFKIKKMPKNTEPAQ